MSRCLNNNDIPRREINKSPARIPCMKTLSVEEQTYKRLSSLLNDMMSARKVDVDLDYVINVLIDTYHDSLSFSGENAGG